MTALPISVERSAQDRWDTIKHLWKQHQWLYVLIGFLAGLVVSPLVQSLQMDGGEFVRSLVPEAIGIGFTVLLIDRLNRRIEDRREAEREAERRQEARSELKVRLLREMASSVNEIAVHAVEELAAHDWLYDGSTQGIDLRSANLRGANLSNANLQGAKLSLAKLEEAFLHGANMQAADLFFADMQTAHMWDTNLQGANLRLANLQGARLYGANLQGAQFQEANLRGAHLDDTNMRGADLKDVDFDENTQLPDRTRWTPVTDMRRFTDPIHLD